MYGIFLHNFEVIEVIEFEVNLKSEVVGIINLVAHFVLNYATIFPKPIF